MWNYTQFSDLSHLQLFSPRTGRIIKEYFSDTLGYTEQLLAAVKDGQTIAN